MISVEARPRRLLSSFYDLERDGVPMGEVQVAWFGRSSRMTVDLTEYDVHRLGALDWELRRAGLADVVARFGRSGAFAARHEITWDGNTLAVRPALLRFRFDLEMDGEVVGTARPAHLFTNRLLVELPDGLPAFVAGLVVWTVVRMRRASSAAAGGS